jgi:RHS repeat-associated protein
MSYSDWFDIASGWNAIEIEYQPGSATGRMTLSVGGVLKQTFTNLNNMDKKIDSVRLGTMGIDSTTRGNIYFDDFESRRLTEIGLLADPGAHSTLPTPIPGTLNKTYSYGDPTHLHAVTNVALSTGSNNTYAYDQAGNMTCRSEGGKVFNQIYNADNRLFIVQALASGVACPNPNTLAAPANTLAAWNFTYDAGGNRVKQLYVEYTAGNESKSLTTYYFAGGSYEIQGDGPTAKTIRYYAFGGISVGFNDGSGLKFLLTDHLGSVVAVTDSSGTLLNEQRYLPFGEVREVAGTNQTDFGYTGQRNLDAQGNTFSLGLMDYNARFYDPLLGRFIQPDTMIPNFASSGSFNRFSYVLNNPIRFNDPSGHDVCDEEGYCYGRYGGKFRASFRRITDSDRFEERIEKERTADENTLTTMKGTKTKMVFQTYIILKYSSGSWNDYKIGEFTAVDFLNVIMNMELGGAVKGGVTPEYIVSLIINNFNYRCEAWLGMSNCSMSDPKKTYSIFYYIANKDLIHGATREMFLKDGDSPGKNWENAGKLNYFSIVAAANVYTPYKIDYNKDPVEWANYEQNNGLITDAALPGETGKTVHARADEGINFWYSLTPAQLYGWGLQKY